MTDAPTPETPTQRRRKVVALMFMISIGVAAAVSAGAAIIDMTTGNSSWLLPAMAVAMLTALATSIPYWRALDEMARRAHETSLYWGGFIAMCFMAVVGVPASRGRADQLAFLEHAFDNKLEAWGWGVMTTLICIMAAYGIAWIIYWLRRR